MLTIYSIKLFLKSETEKMQTNITITKIKGFGGLNIYLYFTYQFFCLFTKTVRHYSISCRK